MFGEEALRVPQVGKDIVTMCGGDDPCLRGGRGTVASSDADGGAFVEAAFEFVEFLEGVHGNAGAEESVGDGIRRGGDEAWVGSIADGADFPSMGGGRNGWAGCSSDGLPDGIRHERAVDEEIHGGRICGWGAGIQRKLRGV